MREYIHTISSKVQDYLCQGVYSFNILLHKKRVYRHIFYQGTKINYIMECMYAHHDSSKVSVYLHFLLSTGIIKLNSFFFRNSFGTNMLSIRLLEICNICNRNSNTLAVVLQCYKAVCLKQDGFTV